MAKIVAKEIKEGKWKESKDKSLKKVINLETTTNRAIERVVEKCVLEHNLLRPRLW
jgi:hypothetical protein